VSATLSGLLAAIFAAPDLTGAACKGQPAAFDPPKVGEQPPAVESRQRIAQAMCADCSALTACAAWVTSLPPEERPGGVVAGQVFPYPHAHRRATTRRASPTGQRPNAARKRAAVAATAEA
jgi:hypothetical protein